ncbi:GTP-binding protein [Flavobacteriales bacterium]|nr:GTP-binding protein [Flavobacteriales bacterium]
MRGCKIHFKIEAVWDGTFGDPKAEIVFIGQNLDEAQIRKDLTGCQIPAAQLPEDWKRGWADSWPVERASPL